MALGGVPVFSLPMGFLNSDYVEIMNELFEGTLFSFVQGPPPAVSRPLAFQEAKVRNEASLGRTRLVFLM